MVGGGGGRFYEVDAALVCDELAGCLVNSTRSLFLSLAPRALFPAPLFYNLKREPMEMPISLHKAPNDPELLFPLRLIANEPRGTNRERALVFPFF